MAARKSGIVAPLSLAKQQNSLFWISNLDISCTAIHFDQHNPITWGYMVKSHGQLVQVSFIRYRTYTPCLSTL